MRHVWHDAGSVGGRDHSPLDSGATDRQALLRAMPVQSEYARERLLELLVGERVAERVDGAVEVAQPVRDVVQDARQADVGRRAEADDEREDVPRRPAEHERAEDHRDRAQSFAGAVLRLALRRTTTHLAPVSYTHLTLPTIFSV